MGYPSRDMGFEYIVNTPPLPSHCGFFACRKYFLVDSNNIYWWLFSSYDFGFLMVEG